MRYKKNLKVEGSRVYSYDTHVATIDSVNRKLYVHGYWSVTTSKHINHIADTFGLEKIEQKEKEQNDMSSLRMVGLIARLGDVMKETQKEANDWKMKMLKAGLENRGLIMPDDWDTLSEDEKTKRLDGAIGQITK